MRAVVAKTPYPLNRASMRPPGRGGGPAPAPARLLARLLALLLALLLPRPAAPTSIIASSELVACTDDGSTVRLERE